MMSRKLPTWAKQLGRGVLALLVVHNLAKGINGQVSIFGWPWFELTYEHGFIRRGFIGTLFQACTTGIPIEGQRLQVLVLHTLVTAGLFAFLAWWGWKDASRLDREARPVFLAGVIAFFLSQLPPSLFLNGGYLDPWILGTTALGAHAATRRRFIVAAGFGVVGALIHDAAIFLWVSVVSLSMLQALRDPSDQGRWRSRLALLVPLLATGLVMLFHSPTAARHAVDALHVSKELKETLDSQQFGFALSCLIPQMMRRIIAGWDHVSLAALLFWPPAVLCVSSAAKVGSLRGWREFACAAVASLAPCAVLLVAWDLSRFLLWACFGSVLLVLSTASLERPAASLERPEPRSPVVLGRAYQAGFIALSIMSAGPFVYAYFEASQVDYALGPRAMLDSPGAYATYWWANTYNRELASSEYEMKTTCQPSADRASKSSGCEWDLERDGFIETEVLWKTPGRHEAALTLEGTCPSARALIEIRRLHRYWSTERVEVDPTIGHVVIPFSVSWKDAAVARFAVRVSAPFACVRVTELRVR